jgi:hypothetical protein
MMNYGVLLLLFLGHGLCDFVFQTENTVKKKNHFKFNYRLRGNLLHAVVYFICSTVLLTYYFSFITVLFIFLLSVCHLLIDLLKSYRCQKKFHLRYSIFYFFADQIIHIITVFAFSYLISINISSNSVIMKNLDILIDYIRGRHIGLSYNEKLLLSSLLTVIGTYGVGVFIKMFFGYRSFKYLKTVVNKNHEIIRAPSKTGTQDGGFIIGILERIFIILAVVFLRFEIIGFVLTTKSIARFKRFDDDIFVEMFIIGTFISFICAITVGIIIKHLGIFY